MIPKVSVIIPVYNAYNYLDDCLDSVINQTLEDIEIICVNDGSKDGSLCILEEYARMDDRVKLINQKNNGAGVARNKGLDIAKGEYLLFFDSDDFLENDMLEKMYEKAIKTSSDIVICDVYSFNVKTSKKKKVENALRKKYIPNKNIFSYKDFPEYVFNSFQNWTWNKLFKKEFINDNNIRFQELYRTNDLLFTCSSLVKAEKISILDDPLVNYRVGQKTNCQSTNDKYPLDFYYAFIALRDYLIRENILDEVKKSFVNAAERGCIYNLNSLKNYEKWNELYEMLNEKGFDELYMQNKVLNDSNLTNKSISKKLPKISIIIPIYNVENYLKECLNSVINQTLEDIEIICVNDGSTDNSLLILEEFAKNDDRIKIISKTNTGYGNTMNIGMEESKGEYIGIVEPDDYISLDMYELLYKKAFFHNLDFIKADFYRFEEIKGKKFFSLAKLSKDKKYYNRLINPQEDIKPFDFIMNTWSGIYKRSFLEEYNIRHNETPGASFQDNGFWFQTFCLATKIYFLNKPFYMKRKDNPNSSVKDKNKVFAMCEEYDFIMNFLNNNPELKEKFIYIYQRKKFGNYLFTLNRIDKKFRKIFLERFHKDYALAEKNNELDEKLFNKNGWYFLQLIINNPDRFYREYYNIPSFLETSKLNTITNLLYIIKKSKGSPKKVYSVLKASRKIKKLRLFDEEFYLRKYPQAHSSNISPLNHYIYHGYKEQKIPSKKFDGNYYLKMNKDVRKSGQNPLIHYVSHGKEENRAINEKNDFMALLNKNNKIISHHNKLFTTLSSNCEIYPKKTLKQIQDFCFELLILIDNICKKHNIEYWLDNTTLYEAVHNHGYMPWDDGIDIGMIRKDYNNFINIIYKELELNNLEFFIDIIRNKYEKNLVSFLKIKYNSPISNKFLGVINIFPYDYFRINEKNSLDDYEKEYNSASKKFREDIIINNLYDAPTNNSIKITDNEREIFEKYSKNLNLSLDETECVISGIDAYKKPKIIKTEDIFPITLLEFENRDFKCPQNSKNYINSIYESKSIDKIIKFNNKGEYIENENVSDIFKIHLMKLKEVNNEYN